MIFELSDEHINDLQRVSILRLIERAKSAHYTDIVLKMRIGGQDEGFEADWLKYLRLRIEQAV